MHEYLMNLRSAYETRDTITIRRFKGSDAIEIRNGITFDFYTGLPHIHTVLDMPLLIMGNTNTVHPYETLHYNQTCGVMYLLTL